MTVRGGTDNTGDLVEPIREPANIERVRGLLAERPRDRLLFEAAIQTGMPVKWLLNLRVADLIDLAPEEKLVVRDDRGREVGVLAMTGTLRQVWLDYLARLSPKKEEYIFQSSKSAAPLKLPTVTNMVNEWFEALGLAGPRGVRSLRRTYEYHFAGPATLGRADEDPSASLKGLKPIQMVSASEVVYQGLLEAIVSGAIPPGERLVPEKIAAQMNVSRMPVREALQRLRAAGFVSIRGRGGMIVNKLSREDLEEIQHIRLILERDAAARATENRDQAAINQLEAIHTVFSKVIIAGQTEHSVKYNKEFHMTIYRQSGMPILVNMIEGLLDRIGPYLHIELQELEPGDEHIQTTIDNHRKMLEGLRDRDAEKLNYWLALDHSITTSRILHYIDGHDTGRQVL